MLWVEKLKTNLMGVIKQHPVSICMFLIGCIALGVNEDISYSQFTEFFYVFWFCFTPCFTLVESVYGYSRRKGRLQTAMIIFVIAAFAISFSFSYLNGFMPSRDISVGGKWYLQYTLLTRIVIVYLAFSVLGSIFMMYKASGLSFEKYCVRAFLGVMRAGLLYGVVALGVLSILYVFDTLITEVSVIMLIQMIILALVGFPAFLSGVSIVSGEITRFSKIVMGYVFPGIIAASCVIVYFYILKIIILRTFPSNEAFAIMTSIFVAGLFIWTASQGCTEDPVHRYLLYFPYVFSPFIIVQIICLTMRIRQYGMTSSRYLGVLLIVFEIVYVAYYAFAQKRSEGVGGILFLMLFASVAVYFLIPGINVYSSVTRSQKAVVEKYLSELSAGGKPTDISLARARSAISTINREGSIEGTGFIDSVKLRYSEDVLKDLNTDGDEYYYGDEAPKEYINAYNSAPVVDVKDYSCFMPVEVTLSEDPIDPKKIPVYPGYNYDKLLTYADLGDIISRMKEVYETTGDSDKVTEVLDQVVVLSDKSALRISSLDFTLTPEGNITELNYRGFYLYNQ